MFEVGGVLGLQQVVQEDVYGVYVEVGCLVQFEVDVIGVEGFGLLYCQLVDGGGWYKIGV